MHLNIIDNDNYLDLCQYETFESCTKIKQNKRE